MAKTNLVYSNGATNVGVAYDKDLMEQNCVNTLINPITNSMKMSLYAKFTIVLFKLKITAINTKSKL